MSNYPSFQPFPMPAYGGFEIREVPLTRVYVQAKRHKRKSSKRWQKKRLKRFGTVAEYRRIFKAGEMLVDQRSGVVYAHPEEARALKSQFVER